MYFSSQVRTNIVPKIEGLKPPPDGYNREQMHGELFFFQFVKRMETDVVTLSNKFWPIFFVMWLAYSLILAFVRIFATADLELGTVCLYLGLYRRGMPKD